MDTHQSLKERKWRLEKSEEEKVRLVHAKRPNFRGLVNSATIIYKIATLPLRITKMLGWTLNAGPFT